MVEAGIGDFEAGVGDGEAEDRLEIRVADIDPADGEAGRVLLHLRAEQGDVRRGAVEGLAQIERLVGEMQVFDVDDEVGAVGGAGAQIGDGIGGAVAGAGDAVVAPRAAVEDPVVDVAAGIAR